VRVTPTDRVSCHLPFTSQKIGSIVGCLCAVHCARRNRTPASGYELSIYQSTPTLVWIGLGSRSPSPSLSDSPPPRHPHPRLGATARRQCSPRDRRAADPPRLHVSWRRRLAQPRGWARDQRRNPLRTSCSILIHTATVVVGDGRDLATRIEPLRGVVCVPARLPALRAACRPTNRPPHPAGVRAGLFAATLFVPVNIAVHFNAHAASQGILYSAFLFYLALLYVYRGSVRNASARG